MTDADDSRSDGDGSDRGDPGDDRRECDICGESVPAAIYPEHLLKACPGR